MADSIPFFPRLAVVPPAYALRDNTLEVGINFVKSPAPGASEAQHKT